MNKDKSPVKQNPNDFQKEIEEAQRQLVNQIADSVMAKMENRFLSIEKKLSEYDIVMKEAEKLAGEFESGTNSNPNASTMYSMSPASSANIQQQNNNSNLNPNTPVNPLMEKILMKFLFEQEQSGNSAENLFAEIGKTVFQKWIDTALPIGYREEAKHVFEKSNRKAPEAP